MKQNIILLSIFATLGLFLIGQFYQQQSSVPQGILKPIPGQRTKILNTSTYNNVLQYVSIDKTTQALVISEKEDIQGENPAANVQDFTVDQNEQGLYSFAYEGLLSTSGLYYLNVHRSPTVIVGTFMENKDEQANYWELVYVEGKGNLLKNSLYDGYLCMGVVNFFADDDLKYIDGCYWVFVDKYI